MDRAVIDTNVLIHGRGNLDYGKVLVVPEVVEEAESSEGRNVLRNLEYEVSEPSESKVEKVREKARELNSPTSEVDEELVALAMERQLPVVTDDKALQNLCLHLDVEVEGFLDSVPEERFEWKKLCSNCGREISTLPCPRCGSRQVRRKQVPSS